MPASVETTHDVSDAYAVLFQQHPQPMWVFDLETLQVLVSNDAAHGTYGYSGEEFRSLKAENIIAPADLPQFFPLWEMLRRGELIEADEIARLQHIDSAERILNVETSWTLTTFQWRQAVLVTVHTSAFASRAEQQTREQANFLDLASDAILVCDLEGKITFWNQGATRLYGWTREEALNSQIVDLLMNETTVLAAVEEGVRNDGEWSGELYQKSRSGQKLTVNSRWTLVKDERDQPKAVLVINTDLTETKRLESQFLRAQRLDSIGTLASGIAHDLNNILSPILMSVGLLRRAITAPDQERMLAMIESSAQRGAEIVKQVLTFARGAEGQRVLLQPKHLITEISKILAQTFPRNIDIQTQFPADLWTVTGDATQLHQVLLNLCVNARDAMGSKGGTLVVAAENVEIDEHFARMNAGARFGDHVVLKVTDTGSGMSPETMDKIFDPFFTTKDVGKGTGLGLATVVGIVKSHSGFLTVQSELEVGTTFRIYIPATRQAAEQGEDSAADDVLRGRGELILVVDDEAPIRQALVQTLEDHGYHAYTAEDGSDALALYVQRRDEIDLVLTDLAMGLMDGVALVRSLRKYDPAVRVVVSSGHCDAEQTTILTGLGVKAFLDKPYNAAKLLRAVRSALDQQGTAQSKR